MPKHKRKGHKGHHPSAKAKKAYNNNILKAYRRLHAVVKKHNPYELLEA